MGFRGSCLVSPSLGSEADAAFASRLAPTIEMHSYVGASLLAKASVQAPENLKENS
jgi:hypothetical protein